MFNATEPLALDDEAAAACYLRLFCAHAHGEGATFEIIETPEALRWVPSASSNDRERVARLMEPLSMRRGADGTDFTAKATMRYGVRLYRAEFRISAADGWT